MASARDIAGKLVVVVILGASGLGLYNIVSDMAPVLKLARIALACPSEQACQLSRYDRRPWEQRFEIFLNRRGKVVRCSPQYLLVGAYQCRVTDEQAAAPVLAR
jgi:hypothetical protein